MEIKYEIVCKGSYALGTACGNCSKCLKDANNLIPQYQAKLDALNQRETLIRNNLKRTNQKAVTMIAYVLQVMNGQMGIDDFMTGVENQISEIEGEELRLTREALDAAMEYIRLLIPVARAAGLTPDEWAAWDSYHAALSRLAEMRPTTD